MKKSLLTILAAFLLTSPAWAFTGESTVAPQAFAPRPSRPVLQCDSLWTLDLGHLAILLFFVIFAVAATWLMVRTLKRKGRTVANIWNEFISFAAFNAIFIGLAHYFPTNTSCTEGYFDISIFFVFLGAWYISDRLRDYGSLPRNLFDIGIFFCIPILRSPWIFGTAKCKDVYASCADPKTIQRPFTYSLIIGLAFCLSGLALFVLRHFRKPKTDSAILENAAEIPAIKKRVDGKCDLLIMAPLFCIIMMCLVFFILPSPAFLKAPSVILGNTIFEKYPEARAAAMAFCDNYVEFGGLVAGKNAVSYSFYGNCGEKEDSGHHVYKSLGARIMYRTDTGTFGGPEDIRNIFGSPIPLQDVRISPKEAMNIASSGFHSGNFASLSLVSKEAGAHCEGVCWRAVFDLQEIMHLEIIIDARDGRIIRQDEFECCRI
jgi:hypothetical protein